MIQALALALALAPLSQLVQDLEVERGRSAVALLPLLLLDFFEMIHFMKFKYLHTRKT